MRAELALYYSSVRRADDCVGKVLAALDASGETLMGQHPTILHFGLGDDARVDSIEVRWPGGERREIPAPKANRYHLLLGPEAERG